ncbi:hypothetical protein QEN58_16190 [Halomonas alkaliantarctica]|uniref:Uncharacterized protein n=1 Tax=Halomonas alkaliantarctica TaxID=232346 RepID=A0ABY8LNC4_9GAMM|nr:hypothetical protein [Halomonas alkaliantarctica]WGI24849.1 hypothetical protein QEN58_16190 [Halomonas alkaliantarctica]
MSQTEQPQDHYAETAFRAAAIPRQAPPPEKSTWKKLGSNLDVARLPWGNYVGVNPTLYEYDNEWFEDYQYMKEDYLGYAMINEVRWSKFVDEDISLLYRFLRFWFVVISHGFSFIGGGGYFILALAVITSIVGVIAQFFSETPEYPLLLLKLPLGVAAFCGIATILRRLYETYSIRFYKSNKSWSDDFAFCRRTGMVKTFRGEFPFYEFDAFIEMRADMKGNQFHSLKVRHRYPQHSKDERNGLPLDFDFPADGNIAQLYAMWDMLGRYMDVSQPLPDIPRLEPFRHLDPTTKAFDEAGKRDRPATYWRDLYAKASEQELKQWREEHRKVVDAAPWGSRPDLMAHSVPGYGDSYTAEPEDINAYGRFPNKADRFVERAEAKDSTAQNKRDNH